MFGVKCCKECNERHPRCHATCERKKAEDERNAKLKKQIERQTPLIEYAKETRNRKQRRKYLKK